MKLKSLRGLKTDSRPRVGKRFACVSGKALAAGFASVRQPDETFAQSVKPFTHKQAAYPQVVSLSAKPLAYPQTHSLAHRACIPSNVI